MGTAPRWAGWPDILKNKGRQIRKSLRTTSQAMAELERDYNRTMADKMTFSVAA